MRQLLRLSIQRIVLSLCVCSAIALVPNYRTDAQAQERSEPDRQPVTLAQSTDPSSSQNEVLAVATVGITVSDMEQAIAFYTQVLPFRPVSDVEVHGEAYERLNGVFGARMRVVQLRLGDEVIELTDYLTPEGRDIPADSRSNDRWFQHIALVVSDLDRAYQQLRQHNVQHVSTAPQRLPDYLPAAAGIEAFYFRDPDGHNLELIEYPDDKGDPRWQRSDALFLGIDHTAIAVSNTASSLRFYRDMLGLQLAGESENYGTEQEHLNNVFGARLRISGLRTLNGIGIELLEYLTPSDGRAFPADAQSNDLLQWQTTLVVDDAEATASELQAASYGLISPGVIEMPDRQLGFRAGFLVRDPDGHVMRIVER